MDKSFDPKAIEAKWYARWEASGAFAPSGSGEPYCILLPPPNVTGTLHMGHGFQHTLMDALIRYHRMRGNDTLWQLGDDHAGIATEMVVTRQLAAQGIARADLNRDQFIERVWQWKRESGDSIEQGIRRIGDSGDWSRAVFTMDPMPSRAVTEAFVRLYEQGLIYRGQKLVNWDPVLKTAISDLEVVSTEEDGFLWSIRYDVIDPRPGEPDHLVVATTRPETMLGDVAVAVHPDDERYTSLVANKRRLRLPLTGREIPVIADDYVDREFGTGAVKVTPAHDFNDYAIWQRHAPSGTFAHLPNNGLLNVFTPSARILHDPDGWVQEDRVSIKNLNYRGDSDTGADIAKTALEAVESALTESPILESIPNQYRGLDRYDARKTVLADLDAQGLLVESKPHKLMVPRGDRTQQVIEPYLTWQWFVKMDGFAKRGLELVESGAVKFVPENWTSTYRHWLSNIQDWCISRQLTWGHRIPAWYDAQGGVHVGRDEAEARALGGLGSEVALTQDHDVLETWFSSALWPFSTMGWPDETAMLERGYDKYLPSSVLVTGFDIIFFWVARMIMLTDHFSGRLPFREVYIHGLVRDKDGQKMSKSKGNVLDPLDLIDGISLDALLAKRTAGLMQPQMAKKIEAATRKEFPDGIPAFGADALRFTFAALAGPGRDIKFDLERCEGYKNFCNKLWNAARFVLMNIEPFSPRERGRGEGPGEAQWAGTNEPSSGATRHLLPEGEGKQPATEAERWILTRLHRTLAEVETQFAAYRFDLIAQALYEFTWNEFCDWFVELAKPALNGNDKGAAESTRRTLLVVLDALLHALHPLIPFVTEEIWHEVAPKLGPSTGLRTGIDGNELLITQAYPLASDFAIDAQAERDIEWLRALLSGVRRIRGEMDIPPGKQIPLLFAAGDASDRPRAQTFSASIAFLARVASQRWLEPAETEPASAIAVIGDMRVLIPLAGLIDLDAERARLKKEISRIESEKKKSEGKLGNANFVANAPAEVVEQERARLNGWSVQLDALRDQALRLATA
ncbi:MAG: valine--tRNA ligase [Rhodanobacteraceae bacterium]